MKGGRVLTHGIHEMNPLLVSQVREILCGNGTCIQGHGAYTHQAQIQHASLHLHVHVLVYMINQTSRRLNKAKKGSLSEKLACTMYLLSQSKDFSLVFSSKLGINSQILLIQCL